MIEKKSGGIHQRIDSVDRALLRELVEDGRATHFALGETIGRSPSSVARRQKALEDDGIITGYGARLDLSRLGHATTIHIKVTVNSQRREILDAFEQAIAQSPSVVRCDLMSGADDYLVTVVAHSLEDFARIHRDELSQLPGVMGMESGFVLREVVKTRLPPGFLKNGKRQSSGER
ncbi:Lrp/AsnC family transcriptional regulator [Altericroceibacterium spongiae]|uniref:Lrp/AsnC family transcriptional regulator n=1 Tax=Altericroceibacterium spongiae TaxID=2320269 RepID=A0A420EC94_9SPHN|nr:Lrp/AsnC family transcriptional regulator [Altericroceibacterium spongiae]RKF18319.1 Lrp/AsnC family transcriptional regulator [Altericroceibacterium spongiae]